MSEKRTRLVAGLGNPGEEYSQTRHNAGFLVIDELAGHIGVDVGRQKFDALYGRGAIDGVDIILAKPMAYMNRSGPPVQRIASYFRISFGDILVIQDDIDLKFGRIKIQQKGGHGGHKGIRSIMDAIGGNEFARIRIGIGRPDTGRNVTGHVLGGFSRDETQAMDRIITTAREAVVTVLCSGIREGMNRFNDRRTSILS